MSLALLSSTCFFFCFHLNSQFVLKGNVHHKYDVSSKVAFCIKDLVAGIFVLDILNHKQKGTICPLTLPSQQSHFSFLSASVYHLIRAMVNFANKIIRFRSLRLWPPKNIKKLNFFRKLFSENSTKLINLIFEPFPKPTLLFTQSKFDWKLLRYDQKRNKLKFSWGWGWGWGWDEVEVEAEVGDAT